MNFMLHFLFHEINLFYEYWVSKLLQFSGIELMDEIYISCCNNSLKSIQLFMADADSLKKFSCAIKA